MEYILTTSFATPGFPITVWTHISKETTMKSQKFPTGPATKTLYRCESNSSRKSQVSPHTFQLELLPTTRVRKRLESFSTTEFLLLVVTCQFDSISRSYSVRRLAELLPSGWTWICPAKNKQWMCYNIAQHKGPLPLSIKWAAAVTNRLRFCAEKFNEKNCFCLFSLPEKVAQLDSWKKCHNCESINVSYDILKEGHRGKLVSIWGNWGQYSLREVKKAFLFSWVCVNPAA